MAESTKVTRRQTCTICLPITEDEYRRIMDSWPKMRAWLTQSFADMPELFPEGFAEGFGQKDSRRSKRMALRQWRVTSHHDGRHYSIRPSFVTPHMTARTADVEKGLFLRKFGVPYWA
ncbi:MAG: hypothetical protein HYR84_04685, partial [Planctomycetes bacterium]|nr:hypothetical protein [Planctomycetota bacterium]